MGALWTPLPSEWIATGWLALVLLLGLAADWKSLVSLALQADILAVLSVAGLGFWDFDATDAEHYRIPTALAIALLYAGMRRKTVLENAPSYVAPAYSWTASLVLFYWIGQVIAAPWLILTWTLLALALFELGRHFKAGSSAGRPTSPPPLP